MITGLVPSRLNLRQVGMPRVRVQGPSIYCVHRGTGTLYADRSHKTDAPVTEQDVVDIVDYMLLEFVDEAVWDDDEDWAPAETPESRVVMPTSVTEGRTVYRKYGCSACHRLWSDPQEAVAIAPELTGIGSKPVDELDFGGLAVPRTLYDWLARKVRDPRAFATDNVALKMPTYGFTEEETQAIVTALLSLRPEPVPDALTVAEPVESDYHPAGEMGRIFDKYRCFSCHVVNGNGSELADADLSYEGSKAEPDWIYEYMRTPFAIKPILVERMPRLMLTGHEAEAVARYMQDVYVDDTIPEDIFGGAAPDEALVQTGRDLFHFRYGCQACHIVEGAGGYYGPSLDNAPGRLKSGWVFTWLKDPQAVKPNSREPNFGMSDEDASALTAYVLHRSTASAAHAERR